ncbi:MAG: hypothetical protein ABI618_14135, partial [Nitrospirota bacterium]
PQPAGAPSTGVCLFRESQALAVCFLTTVTSVASRLLPGKPLGLHSPTIRNNTENILFFVKNF